MKRSIVTSSARRRVQCLRSPIHFFRLASTSANPYPYPSHRSPTPHQIFHLPHNASKADVKARCKCMMHLLLFRLKVPDCEIFRHGLPTGLSFPDYDLVRIYHPDSIVNRAVAPETAQARFQSISVAYDVLRGKRRVAGSLAEDPEHTATTGAVHDYHELSTAMWRAKQRRRAELNFGIDERWKERLFLGAVLLVGHFAILSRTPLTHYVPGRPSVLSWLRHTRHVDWPCHRPSRIPVTIRSFNGQGENRWTTQRWPTIPLLQKTRNFYHIILHFLILDRSFCFVQIE